jgi:hypothetical protein
LQPITIGVATQFHIQRKPFFFPLLLKMYKFYLPVYPNLLLTFSTAVAVYSSGKHYAFIMGYSEERGKKYIFHISSQLNEKLPFCSVIIILLLLFLLLLHFNRK